MKRILLAAALGSASLIPFAALAQQAQPVTSMIAPGGTLLTLSAEGKVSRAPDLAVYSAGVTTQGQTAAEALASNTPAMARVIAALRRAGVADKDIQTSAIGLNPIYGQQEVDPQTGRVTQEARIVGYQANNSVSVKQRRLTDMGGVLDALVAAGANNINGPSFQLDDADAALDEARVAAVAKARARAQLYARAAGLRMVRIVTISESGGFAPPPPMPVMFARAGMAKAEQTPIAAGEVEAQVSVSVQFELAP